MPAKRNSRLGPVACERKKPLACSAGKQNSKSVSHIRKNLPSYVVLFPVLPTPMQECQYPEQNILLRYFFAVVTERWRIPHQVDLAAHRFFHSVVFWMSNASLSAASVRHSAELSAANRIANLNLRSRGSSLLEPDMRHGANLRCAESPPSGKLGLSNQ